MMVARCIKNGKDLCRSLNLLGCNVPPPHASCGLGDGVCVRAKDGSNNLVDLSSSLAETSLHGVVYHAYSSMMRVLTSRFALSRLSIAFALASSLEALVFVLFFLWYKVHPAKQAVILHFVMAMNLSWSGLGGEL